MIQSDLPRLLLELGEVTTIDGKPIWTVGSEFPEEADSAVNGVKRLLDSLEIAAENACETPVEVGRETEVLMQLPVGTHCDTKLQRAHIVAEVVG